MKKSWILICCLAAMALLVRSAIAQEQAKSEKSASNASTAAPASTANSAATHNGATGTPLPGRDFASVERRARVEGEKRFRTNCGRCHQAPHKFPPRVMATAIRHMRVRAMITDEDMRLILKYMTE